MKYRILFHYSEISQDSNKPTQESNGVRTFFKEKSLLLDLDLMNPLFYLVHEFPSGTNANLINLFRSFLEIKDFTLGLQSSRGFSVNF